MDLSSLKPLSYDGNKRTALAAMLVFLSLNGFRLTASDIELFNLVLGVARGELDKAALSVRLRNWLEPLPQS